MLGLVALAAVSLCAQDYINWRNGCPNNFRRFKESQEKQIFTKIAWFGGSITEGEGASSEAKCYRELVQKQIREHDFKGMTLSQNPAAIGGTGSWLGSFRVKSEALYGGASMVMVEFAVNDGGKPEEEVLASMEGIVRQIWSRDSTIDIVFLYTIAKNHLEDYKAGRLPLTIQYQEKVAERYGIPSINMGKFVAQKVLAGELTFEEFAADGVHPTDRGYALYFDSLKPFLEKGRTEWLNSSMKRHELKGVEKLSKAPIENGIVVPYEWASHADAGWKFGQEALPSPNKLILHIATCDDPASVLSLDFKGSQVGVYNFIGADSGDIEYSVDGGDWQLLKDFDGYCKKRMRLHARPLAMNLDPAKEHNVKIRPAAKIPEGSTGRMVRLAGFLVDGSVKSPYEAADDLTRIDKIYASMKPYKVTPPADRFTNLDRTMKRLKDGGEMQIVMLGDSIIGDTSGSRFWLLLERMYPKCKIKMQVSVRGSTGCWWYKNDNQVEPYVLKYNPDLLVIGGISQRDDIESIRAVIRQVRAKKDIDVLLLAPVFGATPDRHLKEWTFDPAPGSYRANLKQLAQEEKCGFFDLTAEWKKYINESGYCPGWFMRDRVHANDRGYQTIGRLLEIYFKE